MLGERTGVNGVSVCILGGSGYGGGELLRLLAQHPGIAQIRVISRTHAGKRIGEVHPNLRGVVEAAFEPEPDWTSLAEAETPVVFSAMPHFALARRLAQFEDSWAREELAERLTLIDLSGDFRLDEVTAFEQAYGGTHPYPQALSSFAYGLPEWRGSEIAGARRIANPGCFATAIQLALLPLAGEHDLGFVAISAATGSSGSGSGPAHTTHHPTRAHDYRAYKVLAHQHQAEVCRLLQVEGARNYQVAFVPHSAPLVRGIFATVQLRLPAWARSGDTLSQRYADFYEKAPFVRVVEGSPRVAAVTGSNFCDLTVFERDGVAVILSALDNLIKGMAGQAIQNMNIALGFPQTSGLSHAALYPA